MVSSGAPLWKRILDITCIIAVVPGWLPLGVILVLWIKIVSRGPIFFKQERIGYRGMPFQCLKFRTMHAGASTGVHQSHLVELMASGRPMTKLDSSGDPRLIRGALLIRSLGLDELPQLLNVLKGEMSLVGPRPCVRYEYEQYQPRHRLRCNTLPGLTGLWQVSGKNRTTFQEMIEFDLYYAAHKSLLLDLKILALTVPALLGQVDDLKQSRKGNSFP